MRATIEFRSPFTIAARVLAICLAIVATAVALRVLTGDRDPPPEPTATAAE